MSYLYENNANIIDKTFELFTEQLILLNKKIELLENKINDIRHVLKIINYSNEINENINNFDIDWNSIHLY